MKHIILVGIGLQIVNCLLAQENVSHPQTPVPPFNYNLDSVEYDNADKTVHLGATFTYPKTKGPYTVALLITGSGLQDRDETILGHKPFAVIADYLSKNGIAVLRVDDRNMGKSKGEVKNATSDDFSNDVLASIQYLLSRNEVNKKKIGLIGHSEGGFIAPLVYTKWPHLAFIISLAGTGVSGDEILLRQQTDPVKIALGDVNYKAYYPLVEKTLSAIHDDHEWSDSLILDKVKLIYADWKNNQPDSVLKALHATDVSAEMYANVQIKRELIPWLRYFIATDPAEFWSKVECPVLALDGQKDIQVYPDQNINAIRASLQKAGNKNFTTKIFPGLNHLFQHCVKCTVSEYAALSETIAPEVLDTMLKWLQTTILHSSEQ